MKRHPQLQEFLDNMTKETFGISNSEAIKKGVCIQCRGSVFDSQFRDEMSKKEYTISALCQGCQDEVFGR